MHHIVRREHRRKAHAPDRQHAPRTSHITRKDRMHAQAQKRAEITSPYTFRTVDRVITHLERLLDSAEAASVFGSAYLARRIEEVCATPGLVPAQERRVRQLLQRASLAGEAQTASM
jgi:hypothetical protein